MELSVSAPDIEIFDRRGNGLLPSGAKLRRLCTGMTWTEGPLVLPWDGSLLFSDIPNNRIMRWAGGSVEVWKRPSHFANGRTMDRMGNILTCEHGGRRVTRTTRSGQYEVVADAYQGRRLNSPNDVVVREADQSIWFTDPPYGIESDYEGVKADREQDGNNVYRFDPATGALSIAAGDFDRPNGLAFSRDGLRLYIADSGASRGAGYPDPFVPGRPHHIRAFDVDEKGNLSNDRVFVDIDAGVPDGLRVDEDGFVWSSAYDGVRCYASDGAMVLRVNVPEITSNLVLEERPSGLGLYITASTSVYSI
jgi:gluconolactonase